MIVAPFCLALQAAQPVPAPPATEDAHSEQPIIVTGERVERTVLQTSSSVSVFSGEALDAQAAPDRIEQVLALVPNVQAGSGGEGPTIRGQDTTGVLRDLPAFLGGTRPRTTVQVDGRATGYNEFVFGISQLWDVDRIEVFRSPQTTTQGRNSIAGAIFVHSRDPTYEWEGEGRVLLGDYDTVQLSAALSGPIVGDQLAFRLAGDLRFSRPSSVIADRVPEADPNRDDHGFVRARLLAEPAALPGLRLEATYLHQQSRAPQIEGVRPPFEARRDPLDGYGIFDTDVDSGTVQLRYRLGPVLTLNSTLAFGDSFVQRFALPGLGRTRIASEDWSAEAVLDWRPSDAAQLIAGVHHVETDLRQFIDVSALVGSGDFVDEQRSAGLFGELSLRPLAGMLVTAGLRYQRDRQARSGTLGPYRLDYRQSFDAWLPRLSLTFEMSDGLAAGVLMQRAYNPGGVTIATDTGRADTFDAETLWNYEAFVRYSGAGGRLLLSANAFYSDMSNAQRPQTRLVPVPGGEVTVTEFDNAPSARTYGLEAELNWRATRRLRLRASLGLLDTEIVETLRADDPIRGRDFQRAPGLSAAASLDWRPTERWRLSAHFRHNSGYFSDDANTPARRVGAASVLDLRTDYSIGPVTVFGFVRNAFDEFYLTSILSATVATAGSALATAGDPREFGIGLHARF